MAKERRNTSQAHKGVSIGATGQSKWRIRWRELEQGGRRISRTWRFAGTATEAELAAIAVYESVQTTGTLEIPEVQPVQPFRPEVADLREVFQAWLAWRKGFRRMAEGTVGLYKSGIRTLTWHLHALSETAETEPIPVTILSIDLAVKLLDRLEHVDTPCGVKRKQTRACGPARRQALLGYLYEAWVWAADDPDAWPSVPTPPRVRAKVVPKHDVKRRPPPAPTWEEMDAVLTACPPGNMRDVLIIQRCTGLRAGQVCGLKVRDLGVVDGVATLEINTGKSRQERAGRTVPVAPVLLPEIRRLAAGKAPEDWLVGTRQLTPIVLHEVFQAAEDGKKLRPEVWRSERRENKRTSHSFRAGFQRGLRRAGVEDRVIDALVGHSGATVRDRHYDDADWVELVRAVGQVPEVQEVELEEAEEG